MSLASDNDCYEIPVDIYIYRTGGIGQSMHQDTAKIMENAKFNM